MAACMVPNQMIRDSIAANGDCPNATQPNCAGCYTPHIDLEETVLLPISARLLSAQQIMGTGQCMAERRGAKFAKK